jgi:predicted transcriptional regulator
MRHTKQILDLWNAGGLSQREIAHLVGCTAANVSLTLTRHSVSRVGWAGRMIQRLSKEDAQFIADMAKRDNVSPAAMARAMLIDAISQAKGE